MSLLKIFLALAAFSALGVEAACLEEKVRLPDHEADQVHSVTDSEIEEQMLGAALNAPNASPGECPWMARDWTSSAKSVAETSIRRMKMLPDPHRSAVGRLRLHRLLCQELV